jgi:hypothetical protein
MCPLSKRYGAAHNGWRLRWVSPPGKRQAIWDAG